MIWQMAGEAMKWVVVIFVALLGAVILWKIFTDKINLDMLVSEEASGKASLSRFQFLLFTMVIAGIWISLCLEQNDLIEISSGVLGLMGISGSGYILSKGIQTQADKNKTDAKAKQANSSQSGASGKPAGV